MTIEERTKKIVRVVNETFQLECGVTCGKFIETQIREAVDEAQRHIVGGWDATEYVSRARAEAYEHAAKIVNERAAYLRRISRGQWHVVDATATEMEAENLDGIASTIRARAAERAK